MIKVKHIDERKVTALQNQPWSWLQKKRGKELVD